MSLNEKLALARGRRAVGFEVIVGAGGGVRSIVQVYEVAGPMLPAASFASTENVCEPAARPL